MSNTRTTTKWIFGLLALFSLAGIGVASAHGGAFGGPFWGRGPHMNGAAFDRSSECSDNMTVGECRALLGHPCNDAMTVGECKAAWEAKRSEFEAERQGRCVEETGNETWCAQKSGRHGPGGRYGPRPHGPWHHGPRPDNEPQENPDT